jgi:adenylate cyclase
VANDEHALHACRAALAMGEKLKADNDRRRRKGLNPVRIRIGIHSGRAVAGNIGAPGRINYTLIGDTVNLAQRLEQLARNFDDGADAVILASATTIAWIGDRIPYRSLGALDVAGFPEPVEVYRLG